MGRAGFERSALTASKTPISESSGAKSGALKDDSAPLCSNGGTIKVSDLIKMIRSCEGLSESTKVTILEQIYIDVPYGGYTHRGMEDCEASC